MLVGDQRVDEKTGSAPAVPCDDRAILFVLRFFIKSVSFLKSSAGTLLMFSTSRLESSKRCGRLLGRLRETLGRSPFGDILFTGLLLVRQSAGLMKWR